MVGARDSYWAIWGKYAIVHFIGPNLEVDIEDMRPANRLFRILGRDGTLQLHIPSTKSPIHCMVGSKTLILLSEMRNVILNRNATTRGKYGHSIYASCILRTDP